MQSTGENTNAESTGENTNPQCIGENISAERIGENTNAESTSRTPLYSVLARRRECFESNEEKIPNYA